jgi:hypothetical protein
VAHQQQPLSKPPFGCAGSGDHIQYLNAQLSRHFVLQHTQNRMKKCAVLCCAAQFAYQTWISLLIIFVKRCMHSIEGRSREAMSPGKDGLAHFQAQISKISPDVLFAQYALFAEQAREVPLLQKGFAGLFSVVRRSLDLVLRTSKQGSSECWYCGLLKQFLTDGAGFAEKKWIKIFISSTPVGTMEKPSSTRMFAFWPKILDLESSP